MIEQPFHKKYDCHTHIHTTNVQQTKWKSILMSFYVISFSVWNCILSCSFESQEKNQKNVCAVLFRIILKRRFAERGCRFLRPLMSIPPTYCHIFYGIKIIFWKYETVLGKLANGSSIHRTQNNSFVQLEFEVEIRFTYDIQTCKFKVNVYL